MTFFARYKKFFLIIGFIALVLVLAYFIWQTFFSKPKVAAPNGPQATGTIRGFPSISSGGANTAINNGGTGGLPNGNTPGEQTAASGASPVALGGVTQTKPLVNSPTLNPTLNSNGGIQYYNPNDGHFYTVNNNGQITQLSNKTFPGVQQVVWAPNKNQAVLEYPDNSKILYNFQTQKQVTLPSDWQDFSFSPSSQKLVSKSIGLDAENNWLVVSNADGSQAKALENIGTNQATVYPSWSPNNQIVAMYTQGLDFNRQNLYFVGQNHENFKSTIIEGRGLETQWSTKGNQLLYSVYSSNTNLNPELWIVGAQGNNISNNRTDIGLATWANKCTFASNTEVYCAVPENLPRGAGMFPELANQTKDNLYQINLTNGSKKLIAIPNGSYNISQVMVSGKNLYFTDQTTKQVYQINLP